VRRSKKSGKRAPRHRPYLAFAVAAILAAATASAVIVFREHQAPSKAPAQAEAPPVEQQPEPVPTPEVVERQATIFDPQATGSVLAPQIVLSGPYNVTDSVTLAVHGTSYRLAYAKGLKRDDVCMNAEARRFPCGLMGRASLQNLVRNNTISCTPVFYSDESVPRYMCLYGEIDLTAHQIAAGFAVPDALGLDRYGTESNDARSSAAGAWDGGWNVLDLQ